MASAAIALAKKTPTRTVASSSKLPKNTQPASPTPAPANRGLSMGMKE
jgi:hypothetical protein